MRARLVRPQFVTVRPLIPSTGDVFGDASIVTSDVRDGPIVRLKMQVTMSSGTGPKAGAPGREVDIRAIAIMRTMDIPPGSNWTPKSNDLIELAGGERLFVIDVQPAFPVKPSRRVPNGGFQGFRLIMANQDPVLSPSTRYE